MLVKKRDRLIYLLNRNPQIRFWYRQLRYALHTKVVKASKLIDDINIIIDKGEQENRFSSNFENDSKGKNSEPDLISNNNFPVFILNLLNQVIDSNYIVN